LLHQTKLLHPNALLNRLAPEMLRDVVERLEVVECAQGAVLAETHQNITAVYFPHHGVISSVAQMIGGGAIETGLIGREGMFGGIPALGSRISLNRVVVQSPGPMSVAGADRFRELADRIPGLKALVLDYEYVFASQTQQIAACNAVHDIKARLCKWLLQMHERVGPEFTFTQEFLAQIMGVRRTSVTAAAGSLQDAGLIAYRRGRIQLLDLDGIGRSACHCHATIKANYDLIFPPVADLVHA
jgi:CRP-like cAMP-binding protein